jgi:hypothetical protein
MKMRFPAIFLLSVVALGPMLGASTFAAKPKVDVQVKVNEAVGKDQPQDSLSRSGRSYEAPLAQPTLWFMNVTLLSDNKEAVAQNNGQWCLKGEGNDSKLSSLTYQGTLSGNDLEVEVPLPNGKIKKVHLVIYDHKWRKLADL